MADEQETGVTHSPAKLRWQVEDKQVTFTILHDGKMLFSFALGEQDMNDLMQTWLQEVHSDKLYGGC